MRIGIDTRLILHTPRHGGANYVYNLVKNVLKIDLQNEYVFLYYFFKDKEEKNKIISEFQSPKVKNKIIRSPLINFIINDLKLIPIDVFTDKLDLFHDTFFDDILNIKCKNIVTIHQVTEKKYIKMEEKTNGFKKFYQMIENISKKTDFIITDSDYIKNILIQEYKFDYKKMKSIFLSADEIFRKHDNEADIKKTLKYFNISRPYLFYSGSANWNKNLLNLISAFKKVNEKNKELILVLTGSFNWNYENIKNYIQSVNLQENVIFTGFVSENELVNLYNGCEIFVMPSLVEGFGISVVEAMCCGAPLLLSDIPVFREVADNSAIYFNPEDIDEMAEKILYLYNNNSLKIDYKNKALERSKYFSWKKTATETLNIYKEIAG